jgi:hypothetical protein
MKVWLDDMPHEQRAIPEGWLWAKNIEEVKVLLQTGEVEELSLDHDLGACDDCMGGRTVEEWMVDSGYASMPNCSHLGTGYDLCLWMADKGIWPKQRPSVHSMNPVGKIRMVGVINRYFPGPDND